MTPAGGLRRWFWGGFLALLMTGVLLSLFAGVRGVRQWAEQRLEETPGVPPPLREVVRVTLRGSDLSLDPALLPTLRLRTGEWLHKRRASARARLWEAMEQGVDRAFAGALERIPDYTDWWYSLGGEYTRLYHAAFGDLPELLAGQLRALVLEPAETGEALDRLVPDLDAAVAAQLRSTARELVDFLTRLILEGRVHSDPVGTRVQARWDPEQDLDRQLASLLALSTEDLARQGLATSSGAAAAALVTKKLGAYTLAKTATALAAKQSLGMLAALAAKLGLKTAAKGGAALGGAGTGAGLCAASGVGAPLTPACALAGGALAGLATWMLVDEVVLEADALLYREQLERELREALVARREALKARLRAHYGAALGRGLEQLGRAVLPAGSEEAGGAAL